MAKGSTLSLPQYSSEMEVIEYHPNPRGPLRGVIVIEGNTTSKSQSGMDPNYYRDEDRMRPGINGIGFSATVSLS